MDARHDISHIIIMGDSLSDRGTLYHRYLLGFIPMKLISGLSQKTAGDSFTNGFPWDDHLIAQMANEFTIRHFRKNNQYDATDIADAVICHDSKFQFAIKQFYHLNDDTKVNYRGMNFVRSYNEGGLSSHDYSWVPSKSISRFFTRIILSNLDEKRKLLLEDDKKFHFDKSCKNHTLVIEWSGANDLITVNEKPSKREAELAIQARIRNIVKLMKHGYRHFVLFNLPDLSLTPRFQARDQGDIDNAHDCSLYFNELLRTELVRLQKNYPQFSFELFDINKEFMHIYAHPDEYQLDMNKLHQSYVDSTDFKIRKDGTSPSDGYMFWDDIHPTSDVHALIANKFCDVISEKFTFVSPDAHRVNPLHAIDDMAILPGRGCRK